MDKLCKKCLEMTNEYAMFNDNICMNCYDKIIKDKKQQK